MGAGASAAQVRDALASAPEDELRAAVETLSEHDRTRIRASLEQLADKCDGEVYAPSEAQLVEAPSEVQPARAPCDEAEGKGAEAGEAVADDAGGAQAEAGETIVDDAGGGKAEAREAVADDAGGGKAESCETQPSRGAEDEAADDGEIPASWGWPAEPFDAPVLRQHVLQYTRASKQEEWDKALAERSVGGTFEDHMVEKAFVNLLLNKEGTGEEKEGQAHRGVDPNAYKKGKWYRFLNASGDCHVYVHNYTRDITATKPDNFTELTEEEKRLLKKLGVFIKELPDELIKIYDKLKRIPIVFGSEDTCEALKQFAVYAKDWQLLDATKLKRVNAHALEESRKAIVNAMKLGLMLCVYLGDQIPDLQEKICVSKNADTFPFSLWTYGGLDNNLTKKKIYRPDDIEAGQYVVRPGFRICVVLMYDSMNYDMSSMRKEELPQRIPNFHHMEQARCYAEHDIKKLLAAAA